MWTAALILMVGTAILFALIASGLSRTYDSIRNIAQCIVTTFPSSLSSLLIRRTLLIVDCGAAGDMFRIQLADMGIPNV